MSDYFQNNMDHIMAELGRIELMIQLHLTNVWRDNGNSSNNILQEFNIFKKQIDTIINTASYGERGRTTFIARTGSTPASKFSKPVEKRYI